MYFFQDLEKLVMSATMIESVQARQRGAFEFEEHYNNQFALQNSCPIPAIKAHLQSQVLDLNADRIRLVTFYSPCTCTPRLNSVPWDGG
jgi:centrosomal protein CEP78